MPRCVFPGTGKRADMVFWGTMESPQHGVTPTREPCTAALSLAYHLTGNAGFAARAIGQAARKLRVARRSLRGGREHADMGSAICSVAAGHGRNWGWGAVTGCYGPLTLGTRLEQSSVVPAVRVRSGGGGEGMPDSVSCLTTPSAMGDGRVIIQNGGDDGASVICEAEGAPAQRIDLVPGETVELGLPPGTQA